MESRKGIKLLPFDKLVETRSESQDGRTFNYQLLWDGQHSPCAKCGGEVGWGLSARKKWIPFELSEIDLDVERDEDGFFHVGNAVSHFDVCGRNQAEPSDLD